jgi:hypothetical protein
MSSAARPAAASVCRKAFSTLVTQDCFADTLPDGVFDPAYTTSTGWLGYDDKKLRRLCREAVQAGWTHFKMKVTTNT